MLDNYQHYRSLGSYACAFSYNGWTVAEVVSALQELFCARGVDGVIRMLQVQYRMSTEIMEWPNQVMYRNLVKAHPSVAKHRLKDLKVCTVLPKLYIGCPNLLHSRSLKVLS